MDIDMPIMNGIQVKYIANKIGNINFGRLNE